MQTAPPLLCSAWLPFAFSRRVHSTKQRWLPAKHNTPHNATACAAGGDQPAGEQSCAIMPLAAHATKTERRGVLCTCSAYAPPARSLNPISRAGEHNASCCAHPCFTSSELLSLLGRCRRGCRRPALQCPLRAAPSPRAPRCWTSPRKPSRPCRPFRAYRAASGCRGSPPLSPRPSNPACPTRASCSAAGAYPAHPPRSTRAPTTT
mmetsp:Transcript_40911/g.101736  ORF Transcript_40911/g.101736 Transcript_40911/m.101736 type:complete len:206 (+) Transcript_40911:431-1048(+)